ncbi:Intradiol ring-cleavage dioxygenase core [Macrophomina phaseolina MS6]|uniref:Intradiol ring-cleavage dioxygenase core n=2 Tax=Macrophomina phaseolina TaxID=35725 RepID=K2SER3_MACPH|nr:Intradiol ring-cleavage dioxygenase core [Macrophomina phaseolina MS6]
MDINNFTIGETDLHTDDSTFLRGMWPTDEHGVMEMKTVFPGFYVKRAIHIHTQVFTDYTLHANGTVKTGNRVSTGQLYFPEELEAQIMALEPYASHTEIVRLKNDEDDIFDTGFAGGYNPLVSVVPADGVSVENGMIGLITMGIDPTAVEEGDVSPNIPSTYDK